MRSRSPSFGAGFEMKTDPAKPSYYGRHVSQVEKIKRHVHKVESRCMPPASSSRSCPSFSCQPSVGLVMSVTSGASRHSIRGLELRHSIAARKLSRADVAASAQCCMCISCVTTPLQRIEHSTSSASFNARRAMAPQCCRGAGSRLSAAAKRILSLTGSSLGEPRRVCLTRCDLQPCCLALQAKP